MSTVIVAPIMVLVILIPVLIGVYVYRDAKRRNMNAVLWTLIALVAPSLIGFIIYLLVRGNYSNLKCAKCNTTVTEQYVVCPKCGAKLRPSCPNCGMPVESDWAVCPKCAQPLPEHQDDIEAPVRPKDNTLWKILIAVILVPIILIVMMVILFSSVTHSDGGTSLAEVSMEQYLEDVDEPRIQEWLDTCDENAERAYVLRYEATSKSSGEEQVRYLIYLPNLADRFNFIPNIKDGLFGTTLDIELENVDGKEGEELLLLTYTGDDDAKLKLSLDGESVECEITEVDFSIAPSDYVIE